MCPSLPAYLINQTVRHALVCVCRRFNVDAAGGVALIEAADEAYHTVQYHNQVCRLYPDLHTVETNVLCA